MNSKPETPDELRKDFAGGGALEEERNANARRIVACVNACKGVSTDYMEAFGDTTFADFKRMKKRRDELQAENARLRQVARDVYEVWAGSEGIPMPETAAEAYLLSLVEQMRDEAKKGL